MQPASRRDLVALLLAAVLGSGALAACSPSGEKKADPSTPASTGASSSPAATKAPQPKGSIAARTCWGAARIGDDPQEVLRIARKYGVKYPAAAAALADAPSFDQSIACAKDHSVEVYKLVQLPKLAKRIRSYGRLLQTGSSLFADVRDRVAGACMTPALSEAARATGMPGAVAEPALPSGMSLTWSVVPAEKWTGGKPTFACVFAQDEASPTSYAKVFTRAFGTARRTCVLSKTLVFVDCARQHDRERVAVLRLGRAVAAGKLPGRAGVKSGAQGPFLDIEDTTYDQLDRGCASYLKAISATKTQLFGVSEVDTDFWPDSEGRYTAFCEADAKPGAKSIVTTGSVYTR